jgi:hypothetical protein
MGKPAISVVSNLYRLVMFEERINDKPFSWSTTSSRIALNPMDNCRALISEVERCALGSRGAVGGCGLVVVYSLYVGRRDSQHQGLSFSFCWLVADFVFRK